MRQHAERAMALDPLGPFVNLIMGRADLLAGDLDNARNWFDRGTRLNPNYAAAIYNHAFTDFLSGFGKASEQGAMKAIALSPIDPLHYAMLAARAMSHIVREEYVDGTKWAEKCAKAPNAHVHAHLIAAMAHELAGDRQASEDWASHVR